MSSTPFTLLAACASALLACSGSTLTVTPDAGGGGDGGGGRDAGSVDASRDPLCPSAAPGDGTACSAEALACEYGMDPSPSCDTVARCSQGHWLVTPPNRIGCDTANPPSCPAAYTDVPQGTTCSPDVACAYPEARCVCGPLPCVGPCFRNPDGAPPASLWQCDTPPPTSGCPLPRPRLGDACTNAPTATCEYGDPCAGNGGINLVCQGGYWQEQGFACPAAAGAAGP